MLTLETVKNYLRVDTDADDVLIGMEMKAASHYLEGAVTDYEKHYEADTAFAESADTAALAIVAQLYEDRTSERTGDFNYTIRTLINQLNLWGEEDA